MSRNQLSQITNYQLEAVALKLVERNPTAQWAPIMQELLLRMTAERTRPSPNTGVDLDAIRHQFTHVRALLSQQIQATARVEELMAEKGQA